jgi:hypothetical protein
MPVTTENDVLGLRDIVYVTDLGMTRVVFEWAGPKALP